MAPACALEATGADGLRHGNRGRMPANKIAETLRERILASARGRYGDINDSHLADLLAEREGPSGVRIVQDGHSR